MSKQPKAILLAEALDAVPETGADPDTIDQAAAEQAAVRVIPMEEVGAAPEAIEPAVNVEELKAPAPSAAQLVQAVAEMFGVSTREARDWLIERAADIETILL